MKLLVVDDSSLIRKTILSACKRSPFTKIETASDGALALTLFQQFKPDVVTLDITMPHMDGLSAMSRMLEFKPNTFIITISALADHHTAIESLTRGAHQFICKPFTADDLHEALEDVYKELEKNKSDRVSNAKSAKPEVKIPIASANNIPKPRDYPSGFVKTPELKVATTPDLKTKKPMPLRPPFGR